MKERPKEIWTDDKEWSLLDSNYAGEKCLVMGVEAVPNAEDDDEV